MYLPNYIYKRKINYKTINSWPETPRATLLHKHNLVNQMSLKFSVATCHSLWLHQRQSSDSFVLLRKFLHSKYSESFLLVLGPFSYLLALYSSLTALVILLDSFSYQNEFRLRLLEPWDYIHVFQGSILMRRWRTKLEKRQRSKL